MPQSLRFRDVRSLVDVEKKFKFVFFCRFSVRLGEHTISNITDCEDETYPESCTKVEDIPIENFIVHENYSASKKINDIGLIRLSRKVEIFSKRKNVRTIFLPVDDGQQIDKIIGNFRNLQIAGWGYTENNTNSVSDVLMKAKVPYLPQEQCQNFFDTKAESLKLKLTETQMCAGGFNKTDSCKGDSGGGIYGYSEISGKLKMFQHGIISIGFDCSLIEPFPGIYTRVSKYIMWILDNMKSEDSTS